ncbi:hypothetical protein [Stakelama pacifica]|uniref:Uncharacterized protein n=1 Tax=Stakelama pacifica TaxID=517720 RepID=A0A4R6FS58_9SPHN|nr:hypothetical protein [Stakelama pacifica]TDN83704.1 hypothetical protein EV664_104188 [Stakelama pacifica]GGO94579.1 hypothetical protein GCM10011329_16790 [Stakelama pacifica]
MSTPRDIVIRRRKEIIAHFMRQDAVARDRAVTYEPDRPLDRRIFERMRARGIVKQDNAGGFYIDVPHYKKFRRRRVRRIGLAAALGAGAIAATIAAVKQSSLLDRD